MVGLVWAPKVKQLIEGGGPFVTAKTPGHVNREIVKVGCITFLHTSEISLNKTPVA